MKLLISLAVLAICASAQILPVSGSIQTPFGVVDVTVTELTPRTDGRLANGMLVKGAVTNKTWVHWNILEIALVMFDEKGQRIKQCQDVINRTDDCTFGVLELSIGEARELNGFFPQVIKKKVSRIELAYAKSWFTPYEVGAASTEQSGITVKGLLVPSKGISFELRNGRTDPIELVWDQSAFVTPDGKSSRIIHSGIRFIEAAKPQPNSLVPPMATINDTAYPAEKLEFVANRWLQGALIPSNLTEQEQAGRVRDAMRGKSASLFLRILAGDEKINVILPFPIQTQ